jgi:hypothetical protein
VVAPVAAPALTGPIQPPKPATSSAPCAGQRKTPQDKSQSGKPGAAEGTPNCEKAVANAPSPRAG